MKKSPLLSTGYPFVLIAAPFLLFNSLGIEQAMAASVFGAIVLLWFTEALPLPVTGLLVPALAITTGVLSVADAFGAFGNQILFLFIGSFLLARSMQKHSWDKRIAYWILSTRIGGGSLNGLVVLIAIVCWLLSMWVSNTATCAMMAPICIGIATTLKDQFVDSKESARFTTRILLTCAFASSAGGMATPVGSPPNMLAIQFLSDTGLQVSFLRWIVLALPLSVVMLIVVITFLSLIFHTRDVKMEGIRNLFHKNLQALGPMKLPELITALCFCLAVVLWILPDVFVQVYPGEVSNAFKQRLPMGAVALLVSLLLFIFKYRDEDGILRPCLDWSDAHEIDWGTVILFGGGLCLGAVLSTSGLATEIGAYVIPETAGSLWYPLMIVVVLGVLISEFSSNTASSSILIPIVLATSYGASADSALQFVVGAAFGASFGFMLPVSTPPNAIVYGTGKIRLRDMVCSGVIFDLLGALLIILYLNVIAPGLLAQLGT